MRLDMLGSVLFQAGVGGPLWLAVLVVVGIVLFQLSHCFWKPEHREQRASHRFVYNSNTFMGNIKLV